MEFSISPSLENYLKMILQLQEYGHAVRVTDLAEKLNIAKSSVNQAVGVLKKQGLVRHERYGPLELTDKGITVAQGITKRHDVLMRFLIDVLEVEPAIAEKDACLMEHAVSPVTMEKLSAYLVKQVGEDLNQKYEGAEKVNIKVLKKLDAILPGTRVKVVKLASKGALKNRLMEMGIIPGTEITVESYAPMGDPIELKVRGYNLAIRKSEARDVFVEKL